MNLCVLGGGGREEGNDVKAERQFIRRMKGKEGENLTDWEDKRRKGGKLFHSFLFYFNSEIRITDWFLLVSSFE